MKNIFILLILIALAGLVWVNMGDKEDTNVETPIAPTIIYTNASADMIRMEVPFPGAVVGKEFRAVGEARGNWYFEASFPLEVLDKDGNRLFQTYATAQGEWMTTQFVPFMSEPIIIPATYIGPATLVLHKDNPSGLPEHDASISFPIIIEY